MVGLLKPETNMAALFSVQLYAKVFVILTLVLPFSAGLGQLCPEVCACLGSIVDCSRNKLKIVPPDLPEWVTDLELQSNEIENITEGVFDGLISLQKIDLSYNSLNNVDPYLFQNLPALKELKFAYNELTTVPTIRHSNLTQLNLAHNKIASFNQNALEHVPKLRILDLNFNKLTELVPGMFPNHTNLHHVFMNSNKIGAIQMGALDNLSELEWLKLNKNKLQNLPKKIFNKMLKLQYLELSRNRFRTLEGLAFEGLENLVTLKLKKNAISDLMDGTFYGLKKIQHLYLDFNNVTVVKKNWLYGLSTLQELYLSHNHITEIEPDGWESCELLVKLDLTHNDISSLNEGTFGNLQGLKQLYLDNNRLSFIGAQAFQPLYTLEVLSLNHNEISWTDEDRAFVALVSLNRLGLDNNKITSISENAFEGLQQLKYLHMTDNAITSIHSRAFQPFESLEELQLNSSNLICDCKMSWLTNWMSTNNFENSVNAKCAHPRTLKGKSVFEISYDDFKCDDQPLPKITQDLTSKIALKGGNVTLKCVAASTSESPMTFVWKKDNRVLEGIIVDEFTSSGNHKLMQYTSILHLQKCQDEDEGLYQCVAANELGSAYSERAKIDVHVFPSFTKTPRTQTVRAGDKASLECAASGDPPPEIAWQKDGGDNFPAARDRRMLLMRGDDVFFIVQVKDVDQGVYSCTATNPAGTIVANATVSVQVTPTFEENMENKVSREGETTVLECMASGSPDPELRWLKDDKPIEDNERIFYTAQNQLLIIVQTQLSDSGRYTCEMTNSLGTERDYSELTVLAEGEEDRGEPGIISPNSTTTGIVIIAVVCCVVGTSLVWVIIIYQTRKKSEEYSSTPTDETTLPGDIATVPFPKDGSVSPETKLLYCNGRFGSHANGMPNGGLHPAYYSSDKEDDELGHVQTHTDIQDVQLSDDADSGTCGSNHSSSVVYHGNPVGPTMQTFHPSQSGHTRHSSPGLGSIVQVTCPENPRGSQKYIHNIQNSPMLDGNYGSRPPDEHYSGDALSPRELNQINIHQNPCATFHDHHLNPSVNNQPPPLPPKMHQTKDTSSSDIRHSNSCIATPSTTHTDLSPTQSPCSSVITSCHSPHNESHSEAEDSDNSSGSETSSLQNHPKLETFASDPAHVRTLGTKYTDVRLPNQT